ncbi:ATP-binding protein [Jeotgalibacillus proteolyticus]|uniref:ATP-binding protein n=1 Tax=Jeotgalibacillus proteolyticus TaxID=2082395 RepID=A0A2S5G9C7_9BACL|nr:ATP-binding protein [Jeotgalibacillus proteolyticus]PPA69524.1 ATP-binding protein [Jeotgalibacillus proteolyticus]
MNSQQADQILVIPIQKEDDIIIARSTARELSQLMQFKSANQARILTAASELARNTYCYAGDGHFQFQTIQKQIKKGIRIIAIDSGPGIQNIHLAMKQGFTTSGSLGAGLPAVKNLCVSIFFIMNLTNVFLKTRNSL